MKKYRVLTNFSPYSDSNLQKKSDLIVKSMTNNHYFNNPKPSINELTQVTLNYSVALTNSKTNDKNLISTKNQLRKDLIATLNSLANYINMEANNNRVILTSSGYDVTKEESESQKLGDITGFLVQNGRSPQELTSKCNGVKNVKSYLHQISSVENPSDADWISVISSTCSNTFSNLEAGKKYAFRIVASGYNNQTINSNIIWLTAQ